MHANGRRRTLKRGKPGGTAAGFGQPGAIGLHGALLPQPGERLAEHLSGADVRGHDDAVVHPLTIAPGLDDSCIPEVSQMPGDFGLTLLQDFDQVADADLLIRHQVEQAEPGVISECLKKPLHVERSRLRPHRYVYTH